MQQYLPVTAWGPAGARSFRLEPLRVSSGLAAIVSAATGNAQNGRIRRGVSIMIVS